MNEVGLPDTRTGPHKAATPTSQTELADRYAHTKTPQQRAALMHRVFREANPEPLFFAAAPAMLRDAATAVKMERNQEPAETS